VVLFLALLTCAYVAVSMSVGGVMSDSAEDWLSSSLLLLWLSFAGDPLLMLVRVGGVPVGGVMFGCDC